MGSARHVGKLVLTMPALAKGHLRDDRTFLITGGFGGIGCAVCRLASRERCKKHCSQDGRRDPDPEAIQTIDELRSRGIRVETNIADVTDTSCLDAASTRNRSKPCHLLEALFTASECCPMDP